MNALVVDTSSWINYFNGKRVLLQEQVDVALKEGRVYLPAVVAAELISGTKQSESIETELKEFLAELPLCDNSFEHWVRVGQLRKLLAKKGITISTPDAHVLQSALDMKAYLVHEDKIFDKVKPHVPLKSLSFVKAEV